jgi:hypothetical protein
MPSQPLEPPTGGGFDLRNQNQFLNFEPLTLGTGGSPEFERMRNESLLRQFQEGQTGSQPSPAPNRYSNIMPSQPLEPPNQPSFDSRQRNMALKQLASREGWSVPKYSMQLLIPEESAARDARDAEAAANFLKEKGVQYDDSRLQDLYQSLFGQQSNNVPAAPSVPAFALPSIQRGSGRDQFSIDPYDQQQAQRRQLESQNMTDYQRLMNRKNFLSSGSFPVPGISPSGGLGGLPTVGMPTDLEIARSLGYSGNNNLIRDTRARLPDEYAEENAKENAAAREYLNSIGYGQEGFDSSKYEVRKQPSQSFGIGSLFGGLNRGIMY